MWGGGRQCRRARVLDLVHSGGLGEVVGRVPSAWHPGAMALKTSVVTLRTVTDAEATRVDAEIASLTSSNLSYSADLARVSTDLASALSRIKELEGQSPPPVPPPPPVPSMARLWVDGPVLRSRRGFDVQWRGMELMWGPNSDANAKAVCRNIKAFGANAISPLFQPSVEGVIDISECLAAARAEGLMVGVNADHTSGGTAWIKRPDIVELCNAADHVMLESEVELGAISSMTVELWKQNAKKFIDGMRGAGHKAPIKIGAPTGGRLPHWGLKVGQELVQHDPEHSLIFTWQAYWAADPTRWQFASETGGLIRSTGVQAALDMADAIKTSGLCFIVGLDGADDIGVTPWEPLAARLHQHGVGWQWWAWFVGDPYGNGVMPSNTSTTPKLPFGPGVQTLLKVQSKLAQL